MMQGMSASLIAVIFAILVSQVLGFVVAYAFQTDKITDLLYGGVIVLCYWLAWWFG